MLSPYERTALFDALRPPPGYLLDQAAGTSFTLDLEALLTAPIAFALFASQEADQTEDQLEPVGLLEAIRRHAGRITMFCQAGQVAVPGEAPHGVRMVGVRSARGAAASSGALVPSQALARPLPVDRR